MLNAQRFPFIEKSDRSGVINMMPYLPLTLTYQNRPLDVLGLLDTGSSINVLPYDIGLRLGAIWLLKFVRAGYLHLEATKINRSSCREISLFLGSAWERVLEALPLVDNIVVLVN